MLPASAKNLRSFGLLMACALLVLMTLSLWKWGRPHAGWVVPAFGVASGAFAGLAVLAPLSLRVVYRPWMALAHVLGIAMTNVLMTLFYFTLLVPFTLIRLKDPLRARMGGATYWEPHKNPEPTLERFRRAF
jgi:hypothetical protein